MEPVEPLRVWTHGACLEAVEPVAWLNPRNFSGTCGTSGVVSFRERHSCQKRIPAHSKNGAAQWCIKQNVVWTFTDIHTLHNSHSSTVEPKEPVCVEPWTQGTCLEAVEPVAWLNPRNLSGTCGSSGVVYIRERHSCQKRIPAHSKNGAAQWCIKQNVVWTIAEIHTLHNSHSSTVEPSRGWTQGTCLEPVEPVACWTLNPRNLSGSCGTIAWLNPRRLSGTCGTSGLLEPKEPVWNLRGTCGTIACLNPGNAWNLWNPVRFTGSTNSRNSLGSRNAKVPGQRAPQVPPVPPPSVPDFRGREMLHQVQAQRLKPNCMAVGN